MEQVRESFDCKQNPESLWAHASLCQSYADVILKERNMTHVLGPSTDHQGLAFVQREDMKVLSQDVLTIAKRQKHVSLPWISLSSRCGVASCSRIL